MWASFFRSARSWASVSVLGWPANSKARGLFLLSLLFNRWAGFIVMPWAVFQ
uniref:Uncharacterized protein n=1 Tax=Arundo donax TaxID=35708 RepID=A0A0A9AV75_ARUDO